MIGLFHESENKREILSWVSNGAQYKRLSQQSGEN